MDGKVASLAAMRVFDGWTSVELRRLARVADLVDVGPDETLVRGGAWHAGCYVLLAGAVVTTTPDGSRLVATEGEFVGLPETLADVAAQADTVSLRASRLLAFTTRGFLTAIEQIPSLRQLAMRQLAVAQVVPRQCTPVLRALAMAPTS